MKRITRCAAAAALAAAAVAGSLSASAAVMTYSNVAAFDAATSGDTTFNFTGIAPDTSFTFSATGYTVGGVHFQDTSANFVIGANAGFGHYGAPFYSGQNVRVATNTVTITLGTPETAVAFDFGSYNNSNAPVHIVLSTGDTFNTTTPTSAGNATTFIGFTSNVPISNFVFTETVTRTGNVLDFTDFTLADAAVPEPSTLAVLVAGLLGLGLLWRRTGRDAR